MSVAGCIPVQNTGQLWEDAVADERLIGDWKSDTDSALNELYNARAKNGTLVIEPISSRASQMNELDMSFQGRSMHLKGYSILLLNIENYIDSTAKGNESGSNELSNIRFAFLIYSVSDNGVDLYNCNSKDFLKVLSIEASQGIENFKMSVLDQAFLKKLDDYIVKHGDEIAKIHLTAVSDIEVEMQKQRDYVESLKVDIKKRKIRVVDSNQIAVNGVLLVQGELDKSTFCF